MKALLTDPQTSGGLLVACAPETEAEVLTIFRRHGFADACAIGRFVPGAGVTVTGLGRFKSRIRHGCPGISGWSVSPRPLFGNSGIVGV